MLVRQCGSFSPANGLQKLDTKTDAVTKKHCSQEWASFGRAFSKVRCTEEKSAYDNWAERGRRALLRNIMIVPREESLHQDMLLEESLKEHARGLRLGVERCVVAVMAAACVTAASPSVMLADGSFYYVDSAANAQPLGEARQAALFLEKLAESSLSGKVLDKVMTVISGQTVVTPETIEGLKSIIDGEKENQDWRTELGEGIGNFWSTAVDVVSQFNPSRLIESAGTSVEGFVELGAERFAAFELSTLVALGERWLLWMPFVVIPMYWQMSRNRSQSEENSKRARQTALEQSEEARAKAAEVREELERIELKAQLLDLVYSLGKVAWQPSTANFENSKRRQIDETLMRLHELNPLIQPLSHIDSGDAAAFVHMEALEDTVQFSHVPQSCNVDGDWTLIYVSQANEARREEEQFRFPAVDLPAGVELSNLRQSVWYKSLTTGLPTGSESAVRMLRARNTAHLRLGPFGLVEVGVQGSWENLKDGKGARVTFDTFFAKPLEVLGSPVREDLPALSLSIPTTLQTSGEWQVLYLDNSLRVNRGRTGQLYVFRKEINMYM